MKRLLAIAALTAALPLASVNTASGADSLGIKATSNGVKNLGGFHPRKNPELDAAIKDFGQPDSKDERYGGNGCRVRWKDIGLQIDFSYFGGGPESACSPSIGRAQDAVVKGKRARRWVTRGVRLGSSTDAVLRAFPRARRHGRSLWLATGYTAIGEGGDFPVLAAVIARHRVKAFRLSIGAAGD
jgi:hypothetical protein